ncbi:MAG: hypothetical protein Crog4KO_30570 [Crocinitomicaceae bacterium]
MKYLLFTALALFSFTLIAGNKTYQAIDTNGNVLFQIEAEFMSGFSDGFASIQQLNLVNNAWVRGQGYINQKGEVVIPCTYKKARDFVDGRAWVQSKNGNWHLIDKKGTQITSKHYEKVGPILEGYSDRIAVYENGLMGWIDRDGNEVIPCQYLGGATFDRQFGLACVTNPGGAESYGFINKQGDVVLPFKYIQAGPSSFENGLCRVNVNGKTVLINEKGEIQFNANYRSVQNYSHGLIAVATKPNRSGWGYCNLENDLIVPAIYDHATTINTDGYGIIELNDNKGLVDAEGTIVLELKYETIYADVTEDGYICGVHHTEEVTSLSKTPKDYFDAQLTPIDVGNATLLPANGTSRIPFREDGKAGYMNRDFKIVIPATYKKANAFSNGIAIVQLK